MLCVKKIKIKIVDDKKNKTDRSILKEKDTLLKAT